jgi:uncharacterized protein YcbK (DUF882 family)
VERSLNCLGKSGLSALRPTRKLSFQKRVALLAKQSESACHAKFEPSAWNMRSLMTSDSVSGADSQSANVVASSVARLDSLIRDSSNNFSLYFYTYFSRHIGMIRS